VAVTERRLEKSIELDATPEQVWAAIATGPGISTWFVPTELEPREGGEVRQDFGGGYTDTGRVVAYEPGRRIVLGAGPEPAEGGSRHAFEYLVEARDGGAAVLRFVQSGFDDDADGWENEYTSFDKGWDLFFGNLRSYLAHFAGLPVGNVVAMAFVAGGSADAWPVLHRALGLSAPPALGAEVVLDGPQKITGVVDVATPEFLGVRSDTALFRFGAEGSDGCGVSAYHYFYGDPVDAPALTAQWQGWLSDLFPTPGQ
jgi:uncharacterized protein YndB with AHSA1/START domain